MTVANECAVASSLESSGLYTGIRGQRQVSCDPDQVLDPVGAKGIIIAFA
jgi:hypothetical protein